MKIRILLFLLILASLNVFSQNQNIGIGTTSPQACALLDISSITKGFLPPRMTYSQKNAINTPVAGLLVYQTNASGANQSGLYYYDGSLWKRFARFDEIGGGGNNTWTVSGDDQYSNVTGNVGIGTTTPTSKFHVVGSVLQEGSTYALNHASGILQFRNSGVNKSYVQLSGNNLRLGTNSGNTGGGVIFRLDGTERMVIDSSGDVGIGTSSPDTRLHVYGGIVKVERNGTSLGVPLSPVVSFEMTNDDEKKAGLVFSNSGTSLAKLLYINKTNLPNVFRFGVSDPEAFDLAITDGGRVGVNMNSIGSAYEGQLHVRGASGVDEIALVKSVMGQSPTIQFHSTTSGGTPDQKEAFVQLTDSEDLRLGTNSGNTTGDVIFRMNGSDRVIIDQDGDVGIATISPFTSLHINDGQDAGLDPYTANGYLMLGALSSSILIDNNEIMARSTTDPSTLYIQQDGGLLKIGDGSAATGTKVQINGGGGSSLSSHGQVVIGEPGSTNITMDVNEIQARNNGGASTLHLQRNGGQLAIGTAHSGASSYKLTVDGKIICEELKVALYSNWPDYVFNENYNLKPLHELKSFIETNHHLPNIPKASEVEREGIEVGEMNRKLLEKIEELTLYIIDLQKQIDDIKIKNTVEVKD